MTAVCLCQMLMEALSRCVAVLTASSKAEDMAVQVQQHNHIFERMKSKLTVVYVERDCVCFSGVRARL